MLLYIIFHLIPNMFQDIHVRRIRGLFNCSDIPPKEVCSGQGGSVIWCIVFHKEVVRMISTEDFDIGQDMLIVRP